MPLIRIDMIKGRSKEEIKQILDISYETMLEDFGAPVGDRYQIVNQHDPEEMQILDTGLGFSRTKDVLIFSLTTRPRTEEQKVNFYRDLVARLNEKTGISPDDIMINLTVNSDADWSFGQGEAQFLNGKLS
ncbi:tautomerase family protein [Pediococcus argentinicus]|uniref:tautomerase family protein n=1 Tax=Pediococcus argentinicus TaxID=480391 RepID=UPI00338D4B07